MGPRPLIASLAVVLAGATACGGSSDKPSTEPSTAAKPPAQTGQVQHASPKYSDWMTYHGTYLRRGYAATMPHVKGTPTLAKRLNLDGNVYASPLIIGGVTIVATENDTVYAFGPKYEQLWKRHLATPSPRRERECGDIDPLGITGTPVYSRVTHDVYVVAEHGGTIGHELVALSARTGKVVWQRNVDLPGADPGHMQQRGALTNRGGRIWVPYGAQAGDCGDYKGRVIGVRLDGTGKRVTFDPSTRRQGGIWNPQGGTVDAGGYLLFVSANGSSFPGDAYDHTNSVDKINTRGHRVGSYAPSDWAQNNQGDVGLGSNGPAVVGHKWLVVGGKSGPVYVLHQKHLGGIGGEVSQRDLSPVYGGSAVVGSTVFMPSVDGIYAARVSSTGHLHVLWKTDSSITGSPVVGGGRVWALDQNAGVLHALSMRTGKTLEQVSVGQTSRFATPAIYGRNVYVPTLAGVSVVRTS